MIDEPETPENENPTDPQEPEDKPSNDPEKPLGDDLPEVVAIDWDATEKPKDFPDELWDAENGTYNKQAIYDAYGREKTRADNARKTIGKGLGKPPKDASEYTFDGIDDEGLKDDPFMQKLREDAHEAGIPASSFSDVGKVFYKAVQDYLASDEGGELSEAQQQAQQEEEQERQQEELKKLGDGAFNIIRSVNGFTEDMKAKGVFNESHDAILKDLMKTADGVNFLNRLRKHNGGEDVSIDAIKSEDGTLWSKDDLQKAYTSEKYDDNTDGYRNTVDAMAQRMRDAGIDTSSF